MNLTEAMAEVGAVNEAQPFGQNTKMPGPSYDLPAWECKRGTLLSSDRRSMCHKKRCYAKRGFFRWRHVKERSYAHLASLTNARWVEAFIFILRTVYRKERWFRWHAAGDLQSKQHLRNIIDVARGVPHIRFWLPTHEPFLVAEVLRERDYATLPDNLTIRISADAINALPNWDEWPLVIRTLPASMVHPTYGEPPVIPGKLVFECRSHDRDNECGKCRVCWSHADVVSYPETTTKGVTTQRRLPVIQ